MSEVSWRGRADHDARRSRARGAPERSGADSGGLSLRWSGHAHHVGAGDRGRAGPVGVGGDDPAGGGLLRRADRATAGGLAHAAAVLRFDRPSSTEHAASRPARRSRLPVLLRHLRRECRTTCWDWRATCATTATSPHILAPGWPDHSLDRRPDLHLGGGRGSRSLQRIGGPGEHRTAYGGAGPPLAAPLRLRRAPHPRTGHAQCRAAGAVAGRAEPIVATYHTATPRSRTMELAGSALSGWIAKIDAGMAVSESARQVVVHHLGLDAMVVPERRTARRLRAPTRAEPARRLAGWRPAAGHVPRSARRAAQGSRGPARRPARHSVRPSPTSTSSWPAGAATPLPPACGASGR